MDLWEIELKLESAFMTPWHADIIFGHLAWAYYEQYGEEKLQDWLHDFTTGDPPFVLSDAYITGSFPRPFLPPPEKKVVTKQDIVRQIKFGKKIKKQRFIHENDFNKVIDGKEITFKEVVGVYHEDINIYNTINRVTGSSLDADGLYELKSTHIQGAETISIFLRVKNEQSLEQVAQLLRTISLTGYGKKKNIGFGQFRLAGLKARPDLDRQKQNAEAVVWLSHGVPKTLDPVEGFYKLETKYGKVGGALATENPPYKRPLTRIVPGAVFKVDNAYPYYGRMVAGIYPRHSSVVQYGYALAIPLLLPNYLKDERLNEVGMDVV